MKKSDYERIRAALNELSLFIFECMQKDYPEQQEKALNNKRLLSLPPEEVAHEQRVLKMLQSTSPFEVERRTEKKKKIQINDDGDLATQKEYQMIINLPGVSINSKPRSDGRYQGYIVDIKGKTYVYGHTQQEVAAKIKLYLQHGTPKKKKRTVEKINGVPITFTAFSTYYFENFRQKKVAKKTFDVDKRRFDRYLRPYFKETPLKKITPKDCQTLIESIEKTGKGKTADEIYSLMSVIFKVAIKHGILQRNPLEIIFHLKHEHKHGKALSREEETLLKKSLLDSPLYPSIMLMLYTGLRPNELSSVKIDGDFIVAVNSKRKHKHVEYKKIPIIKALRPYIGNGIFANFNNYTLDKMRSCIKSILPEHILYDLRTTFYSRCKEYGVSEYALSEYMGHSLGAIANAYTDLSDEYLLNESKKLDFWE